MGGGRRRQPGVGQGARSFLLSSDEDEGSGVSDTLYLYGAIDAALQRECDYAAAVDELEQLLRSGVYHRNFSKPAQAAVQKSLFLAVVKCTSRVQHRRALTRLMAAVEKCLPQAKRNALLREYKKANMALKRIERKGNAARPAPKGSDGSSQGACVEENADEDFPPPNFVSLPREVLTTLFRHLDPLALAGACCVCWEWRQLAGETALWEGPLRATFSPAQQQQLLSQAREERDAVVLRHARDGVLQRQGGVPRGQGLQSRPSIEKLAFDLGAQRYPRSLLFWRTSRIMRGGRLSWLTPQERQAWLRHTLACSTTAGSGTGTAGLNASDQAACGVAKQAESAHLRKEAHLEEGLGAAACGTGGFGSHGDDAPHNRDGAVLGRTARRYRHLAPETVVRYYQAGGRLGGSSGGSTSESEEEGGWGALGGRLRFWRLE